MMTPYDIRFGNDKQLSDFDAVCTEFPFIVGGGMKEPYTNNWYDEDGEDVYISPTKGIKESSYSLQISIAIKGYNLHDRIRSLIDYLKSKGKMTIENTYVGFTYKNAYLTKYTSADYYYDREDKSVAVFSLTFNITNENED